MHVKQYFWGLFEQMSCVVKHVLNTESQVCKFQTLSWSCLHLFMYLFIIILSTANSAFFTSRIIIINYYSMGFFISLLLPAWIQIVAMCKNIMLVVSLCFLHFFYCTNVFELYIICSRKVNMCLCKHKIASLAPQSSTKDSTKIKYLLNCRTGAEDLQSFRHC